MATLEIDWSDFYNFPEPKPKGDTTGPTSFFDNPYLTDEFIESTKLWGTNQLPWGEFVEQERSKHEYNFAANAPDDKEGLAKALASLDGPEPGTDFTDFKPGIPKDDPLLRFDTWAGADAYGKKLHNQAAAFDARRRASADPTTDEGKSTLAFLNKYQVYAGQPHWVDAGKARSDWEKNKSYWDFQGDIARGREPGKDDAPYRPAPKPGDPDYTPPPSFPGQDIPTKIADAGIPRTADWTGEGRPAAPESGMKWYPTTNPNDPGGGFWSPDLNHEKWKVENLGGEIGQIASSEGLQPGMIPSLQDNLARDTKQQRLAQETGTAIRQLETDQRSSEPTLAERLQNIPSLGSNIPGLPTGIGSNFIKTANDYLNIGSTAEKSRWGPIDMLKDEFKQRGLPGDGTKGGWDVTRGLRPGVPASQGGFGSGPTELARRALKTGGRLAKGAANLGVGIAADWAADKFLMPHVEKAGQRMGKSLKNWANEFDARGSQYNPTLNRNVLRIPN